MNPENTATNADAFLQWQALTENDPTELARERRVFRNLALSRLLSRNLVAFFLQYLGLLFTTLASPHSAIWFASGTSLALLFLRGIDVLPGVALGSLWAYYSAGLSLPKSLVCSLILLLQAFILMKLCYRSSIVSLVFIRLSSLFKFLFLSAGMTFFGSALLTLVCFSALSNPPSLLLVILQWWFANLNGILIMACALFAWDAFIPELPKWKTLPRMRLTVHFFLWAILIASLLNSHNIIEVLGNSVVLIPGLIFLTKTYRWCGLLAALLIFSLMFDCAALINAPFFTLLQPRFAVLFEALISLNTFLCMIISLRYNVHE